MGEMGLWSDSRRKPAFALDTWVLSTIKISSAKEKAKTMGKSPCFLNKILSLVFSLAKDGFKKAFITKTNQL